MLMNTIDNTPKHCHDCHSFSNCHQAQNMMAGTEPVNGYVWAGVVCCAKCDGEGIPYRGKSDSPTHCDGCGVPIIHELTDEGVKYVRNSVDGCCREVWPTVWGIIPIDSIVIPERFVRLCKGREGKTNCTLRDVSFKGNLTTGTHRLIGCDSDEKWYLAIWRDFAASVFHVSLEDNDDCRELLEFEFWVNEQVARLEESYGLADWDN